MTVRAEGIREPDQPMHRSRTDSPGASERKPPPWWTRFGGLPFVLPSILILIVVMIVPIAISAYLSLTDYTVLRDPEWVGGKNFVKLVTDPAFLSSIWITVVYTVISVPLQTVVALILADLLAKRFRGRFGGFVRSALFIPVMSSLVVVAVVWRALLGTDAGFVNAVLTAVGLDPINFLGQPVLALVTVSLVTVWKNIGYFLVIYYAGIMEVPSELYEASSIDGANRWQQLWRVTVPSLRPVTFLVVILGTIWSFQVFDLVYVMTGGGPGGATRTIVMMIYEAGFRNFQMGYASAMAMVLFAVILLVAIVQRKVMKTNVDS